MRGHPPEGTTLMQRLQRGQWSGHPGCSSGHFGLWVIYTITEISLGNILEAVGSTADFCVFQARASSFVTALKLPPAVWAQQKQLRDRNASSPKPRTSDRLRNCKVPEEPGRGLLGIFFKN